MDKIKRLVLFAGISTTVVSMYNSFCALKNTHPSARLLVATGMAINALCIHKLNKAFHEAISSIKEIIHILLLSKRQDEEK